jgi:hypothetical protein
MMHYDLMHVMEITAFQLNSSQHNSDCTDDSVKKRNNAHDVNEMIPCFTEQCKKKQRI